MFFKFGKLLLFPPKCSYGSINAPTYIDSCSFAPPTLNKQMFQSLCINGEILQ